MARRRFRIACPPRVDMRARNPCLRFRRRTFGWYVRFTVERSPSLRRCPHPWARRSAEYRRAPLAVGYPQRHGNAALWKRLLTQHGCRPTRAAAGWLSTSVETRVETLQIPAKPTFFAHGTGGLSTDGASEGWYARPFLDPEGAPSTAWSAAPSRPPNVSGTTPRGGSGTRSTRRRTRRGSARLDPGRSATTPSSSVVPNDFTRNWIESHFLGLLRAAVRDALGREMRVSLAVAELRGRSESDDRTARADDRSGRRRPAGAEPQVHVRQLRDRLVEPVRPRRRARGRRGAGAGVQPALHLRRHRARQDPPPAGDRRTTSATTREG